MPSSVIRSFSYDETRSELIIVFQSGRVYVYEDVPSDIYEAFRAAFAKGEFFNVHIRDRFAFRRLER